MPTTSTARVIDAHRLFFALWPDDALRGAMVSAVDGLVAAGAAGRRVDPSRYHLTLQFVGGWPQLPAGVVERCRAAAAAVEASAFHLVVDHAGSFARSRVGWLAPSGNSGLDALWSALGHALDAQGVEHRAAETFSPHVTVLRDIRHRIPDAAVEPLSWPVDAFVLVHSHGGHYDVLERWAMQPGD